MFSTDVPVIICSLCEAKVAWTSGGNKLVEHLQVWHRITAKEEMESVMERASTWVGDRNQDNSVETYKLGKESEKWDSPIEEANSWGEADQEAKAGSSSPKMHNVMESIMRSGTHQIGREERIVNKIAVNAVGGTGVRAGSLRKFHLCEVEDCGAKFSTKPYLKRHIESFHKENEEKETRSRQRPKLLHIQNQSPVLSPSLNKTLNNNSNKTLNNNSKGRTVSRKKVPALIKEQGLLELTRRRTSPQTKRILALQSSKKIEIKTENKLLKNWQNGQLWY